MSDSMKHRAGDPDRVEGNVIMAQFGIPRRPAGLAANTNEPQQVNWRRGLFRIWILMSAAWIMGWVVYLALHAIQTGFRSTAEALSIPVLLFGPPIALFLFGLAAGWAFRGFRTDKPGG
jgi:hypothetical protein